MTPRLAYAAALLVTLACTAAVAADTAALIKEFKGETPAVARSPEEMQAAFAAVLDDLSPDFGAAALGKREAAEHAFEVICLRAGRPGAEAERAALGRAIAAKLPAAAPAAKPWLVRQLQHVGRAEAVPALVALLADADPALADAARRALQVNPSPEAGAALRAALAKAAAPDARIALLNALGDRRDAVTAAAVAACAKDKDPAVQAAAVAALGTMACQESMRVLMGLRVTAAGGMKAAVLDAFLRTAERSLAAGRREEAFMIYQREYADTSNPDALRGSALRGMAASNTDKAAPAIGDALAAREPPLRAAAMAMAFDAPGPAITRALVAALPRLAPPERAALVTALGQRGDLAARPAVLETLKSKDPALVPAAVRAITALGDAQDVPLLVQMAAATDGDEQARLLAALRQLPSGDVNGALLKALESPLPPAQRIVALKALSARRVEAAAAAVLKATGDANFDVRTAAVAALGAVGDAKVLPAVAGLLTKAQDDEERAPLLKSIASICARMTDKDACAEPLLAVLRGARGAQRTSLIQVLGQTGSPKALEALRGALKDADPAAQDAAVRALAEWPTDAPAADLLAVAKADGPPLRQILALRGYVRAVGLGKQPPAEKAKRFQEAMAAAPRAQEKKIVLAALAAAPSAETLQLAAGCMDDAELRPEAAAAVVALAGAVAGAHPEAAKAALRLALEGAADAAVKQKAGEILASFEKSEDFILTWLVSGPYTQEGKDGAALFAVPFPPEQADPAKAAWKPVPAGTGGPDRPWLVNFVAFMAGDNRVAYLKAAVFSPKAQEAQLEVGSDDGVQVWLGGKPVHANNAMRAAAPGEDKVKVALAEGWNTLLLKVNNGGGDWGACARVRATDGSRLPGLRLAAEPPKNP